jgi:hypothetical protein
MFEGVHALRVGSHSPPPSSAAGGDEEEEAKISVGEALTITHKRAKGDASAFVILEWQVCCLLATTLSLSSRLWC